MQGKIPDPFIGAELHGTVHDQRKIRRSAADIERQHPLFPRLTRQPCPRP